MTTNLAEAEKCLVIGDIEWKLIGDIRDEDIEEHDHESFCF